MATEFEKIEKLAEDKEGLKELLAIDTAEGAQKWFSDHDIELSIDEVKNIAERLNSFIRGEVTKDDLASSDELTSEELAEVSGGSSKSEKVVVTVVNAVLAAGSLIAVAVICGW